MTKQQWLTILSNDYIYRVSDGWGGVVTNVASKYTQKGNLRKLPKKNDRLYLNIYIKNPNNEEYPSYVEVKDCKQWEVMKIATCKNVLALVKFSINISFDSHKSLIELESALRNRSVL